MGGKISTETGLGSSGSITVNAGSIIVDDENTGLGTAIVTENTNTSNVQSQDAAGGIVINCIGAVTLNAGGTRGSAYISSNAYALPYYITSPSQAVPGNISITASSLSANGYGSLAPNGILATGGGNLQDGSGVALAASPSPGSVSLNLSGGLQLLNGAEISTNLPNYAGGAVTLQAGSISIEDEGQYEDNGRYSETGIFASGILIAAKGDVTMFSQNGGTDIQSTGYLPNTMVGMSITGAALTIDGNAVGFDGIASPSISIALSGPLLLRGLATIDSGALNITAASILAQGPSALSYGSSFGGIEGDNLTIKTSGNVSVVQGDFIGGTNTNISAASLTVESNADYLSILGENDGHFGIVGNDTVSLLIPGQILLRGGFISGTTGSVAIRSGSLVMEDNGQISAGVVSIAVADAITMLGQGTEIPTISSQQYAISSYEPGGGRVDITARSLMAKDASIQSENDPIAYNEFTAPDGEYFPSTPYYDSTNSATGGQINIRLRGPMDLLDNSTILATTYDAGNAGSIEIADKTGNVNISSGSRIDSSAALYPNYFYTYYNSIVGSLSAYLYNAKAPPNVAGAAGAITIQAENLKLNAGQILTSTVGTGGGGAIALSIGQSAFLDGSQISTQSAAGGGGTIRVATGGLLFINDGLITSQVRGGSLNAGNTTITAQTLVLDSSQMSANAFGGRGGNINVDVGGLLSTPDSAITATSARGVSGIIAIDSQFSDVTASLADLSGKLAIANQLSHLACAGGFSTESSLVLSGRGSLPADGDTSLDLRYGSRTTLSEPMVLPDQAPNALRPFKRLIRCSPAPDSNAAPATRYRAWWMASPSRLAKNASPRQRMRRAA